MKDELFEKWCIDHCIDIPSFNIHDIFEFEEKKYFLINSNKESLFDDEFVIFYSPEELEIIEEKNIDFVIFRFGSFFYYSNPISTKLELFTNVFRPLVNYVIDIPYVGIHGEYELGNGSRLYKDWVKKAKWLGIKTLGICEYNTLGGVYSFQEACKKEDIKPIIGATFSFKFKEDQVKLILFARNEKGFEKLIKINNSSDRDIYDLKGEENLLIVLSNETDPQHLSYLKFHLKVHIYYQIDLVEWDADGKDKEILLNFKKYFDNNMFDDFIPIFVQNSFFIEKNDHKIQRLLNKVVNFGFNSTSKNHYFKNWDETEKSIVSLFENAREIGELFFWSVIENTEKIFGEINFSIKNRNLYLPKYELDENQLKEFSNEDDLLFDLIQKGMVRNGLENSEKHWNRITEEYEVIKEGGFVSYFLILYDIINFCKENDIMWGVGRGSAAGCAIAFLLEIVQIDPLDYDLLFERFLNRGRLKKGLPDIDFDVQGTRRDDVKKFMQDRYGHDRIASIGTYSTMKIKAAIKDLSRQFGVDPQYMNFITKYIEPEWSFTEFMKNALTVEPLKEFLIKHQEIVELLPLCLNQCKNTSIHAAGVVITPRFKGENSVSIDSWIPSKERDGMIVTEWEGTQLDEIGFLKNDILGIAQLDKFKSIIDLIVANGGPKIEFKDIDLNCNKTFNLFQNGLNEDIFQFNTDGLKKYSAQLKPTHINDIIAAVALYRPGPMLMGTHEKYVKLKHGEEEPTYYWNCEEITKSTFGLIVYQEQAIRICQKIGGFDLVEADDVRKAIGKKIQSELDKYSVKFTEGAIKNGCPEDEAFAIWDTMEKFGAYSFNLSHAASYGVTAYYSQWFKANYPLEFYVTALKMGKQEQLSKYILEINENSDIEIVAPDINKSTTQFEFDKENKKIFWSLSSIKWVSEKVLDHIFSERDANGAFFSLNEFLTRVDGRICNKRVIVNLILSGAFDSFRDHGSDIYENRLLLLHQYYKIRGIDNTEIEEYTCYEEYEWIIKQKELSSYGEINFKKIYLESELSSIYSFLEHYELMDEKLVDAKYAITGLLVNIIERKSKNGIFAQLQLDMNGNDFYVTVWNEQYEARKEEIENHKNKVVIVSGIIKYDGYKKQNVLHTTDTTRLELV